MQAGDNRSGGQRRQIKLSTAQQTGRYACMWKLAGPLRRSRRVAKPLLAAGPFDNFPCAELPKSSENAMQEHVPVMQLTCM